MPIGTETTRRAGCQGDETGRSDSARSCKVPPARHWRRTGSRQLQACSRSSLVEEVTAWPVISNIET